MPGRYLIGIDNGSQSTKVVIYDVSGNAVAEGRQALRPAYRPRPGVVQHPDDEVVSSAAPGPSGPATPTAATPW